MIMRGTHCALVILCACTLPRIGSGSEVSSSASREVITTNDGRLVVAGEVPLLLERTRLGRGLTVDHWRLAVRGADASRQRFVVGSPELAPRLLTDEAATATLRHWWPEDGDEWILFCLRWQQSREEWSRAVPVMSTGLVPSDALVPDARALSRLSAPWVDQFNPDSLAVSFWVVRSGGASQLECTARRSSGATPAVSARTLDSIPGLGFVRLGG